MLRAAAATAAATAAACLTLLQRNYDATENEPLAPGGSVVVVGAGVVGVSTADELSRRGFRVTVLEASAGVAGAASASHGNACTLGVSGKWQSLADAATLLATLRAASPSPGAAPPPPDAPFETRHAFHATNKFVDASLLGDPWFYAWGLAMLKGLAAGAPAMEAAWRASNEAAQRALIARAADVGFRGIRVDGSEKVRFAPGAASRATREACAAASPVAAAAAHPEDGRGDCAAYTRALAADCRRREVTFVFGAAASALEVDADGAVEAVRCSDGRAFAADRVVVCAGAATPTLLRSAGLYAPVQPLRGYSITARVTAPGAVEASLVCAPYSLYATRVDDATVRFTCYGELVAVADAAGAHAGLERRLRALVAHALPAADAWCDWRSRPVWSGSRPTTPDCCPLVGPTRVPRLFLNTGHSFNGWRESAQTAAHLGAVVAGDESPVGAYRAAWDPARFAPFG